jgi:POT family proton-dependent oligopeptide transporter
MVISPLIKRLMHLDTLTDDDTLEGAAEAGLEAQEGGVHPATKV